MDCKSCRQNLEAYRREELSDAMMTQVRSHLLNCIECDAVNRLEIISDRIIASTGETLPGSLASGRIMEYIERETGPGAVRPGRVISIVRPVVMAASVAAALFAGILIGDLYGGNSNSQAGPEELSLLNDSEMEMVFNLSDE